MQAGAEPAPEKSCVLNMSLTMDNIQHNCSLEKICHFIFWQKSTEHFNLIVVQSVH
jgi:hypothetical protein